MKSSLRAGVAPRQVGEAQLIDGLKYQLQLGPRVLGDLSRTPLFFPRLQAPSPTLYSGQSPTWQDQLPGERVLPLWHVCPAGKSGHLEASSAS